MNARSEPLIWLQLIAVGVWPLEALLLLLLLAGSDPGPLPALERLLCWGLGGLLPALMLWRRPADIWSLLLLQIPLKARRPLQQRLSALQDAAAIKAGLVAGSGLLLALLWWSDEHAALAAQLSPLAASPRLVGLLLAALLLAVMLWQWQQLLQTLWLLSRSPGAIATATPMTTKELEASRLCLGLPLLLIDPLPAMAPESRSRPTSAEPTRAEVGGAAALSSRKAKTVQPSRPGPADQDTASGSEPLRPSPDPLEAPSATAATAPTSRRELADATSARTPATPPEPTPTEPPGLEPTNPEPRAHGLTTEAAGMVKTTTAVPATNKGTGPDPTGFPASPDVPTADPPATDPPATDSPATVPATTDPANADPASSSDYSD